jgi:FkbM family methyltransferase
LSTVNVIEEFIGREYSGIRSKLRKKHFRGMTAIILRDYFFELSKVLEVDLLIEVGAHSAEASIRFLSQANRLAIAFEANTETFEHKTKLAIQHGVIARNEGISSIAGFADFFIPLNSSNSLMPENASFRRKNTSTKSTSFQVSVTTVDNVLEELAAKKQSGLWVDAEGLGLEVLKGASRLLNSGDCQLIMIEVELKQFWVDQAQESEIEKLLVESGFFCCMMDIESEFQRNLIFARKSRQNELTDLQEAFKKEIKGIKSRYLSWRAKNILLGLKAHLRWVRKT